MAKKHVWRIKKEYFRQLKNGSKRLEVRVGYPQIKRVKKGDLIAFENYGPNEFEVVRVSVYDSFERMLKVEGVENILPGMTMNGAIDTIHSIYSKEKEALGVYIFELRFKNEKRNSDSITYARASDLLKKGNNKEFSKI